MNSEELRAQAKAYAHAQDLGDFDNADDRVEDGYTAGFDDALAEVRTTLTEKISGRHAEMGQTQARLTSRASIIAFGAYIAELEAVWDTLTDMGYANRRPFRETPK